MSARHNNDGYLVRIGSAKVSSPCPANDHFTATINQDFVLPCAVHSPNRWDALCSLPAWTRIFHGFMARRTPQSAPRPLRKLVPVITCFRAPENPSRASPRFDTSLQISSTPDGDQQRTTKYRKNVTLTPFTPVPRHRLLHQSLDSPAFRHLCAKRKFCCCKFWIVGA